MLDPIVSVLESHVQRLAVVEWHHGEEDDELEHGDDDEIFDLIGEYSMMKRMSEY